MNKPFKFKLDTGAQVNFMPEYLFRAWKIQSEIQPCKYKVVNYEGSPEKVTGYFILRIDHKDKKHDLVVIIVETEMSGWPVLGLTSCIELDLDRRVRNISE